MDFLVTSIRENPELAIFLTLAIGFAIGRVRLGTFSLGNVVGTLLAGVLVGQLGVDVDPLVKVVFFDLFLFATGYKVGPQFFKGLGRNAVSQGLLTVVLCVTSLGTTVLAARVMGYDCGTAAGLMAGAFTESTVIGTAGNTIARLDISEAEKTRLMNNIPVAYAVSYLVGTGFVVWFLSSLAPKLMRIDLKREARLLAGGSGEAKEGSGTRPAHSGWDVRAYRVTEKLAGRTVADVEASFAPARVFVQRIRHGDEIIDGAPGSVLRLGDVAVFSARREVLLSSDWPLTGEVDDKELLHFHLAALDVVVTSKEVANRPMKDIAADHGRGVVLAQLVRAGEDIPFSPETIVNRGDLLRVVGAQSDVERAGKALGYVDRPSSGPTSSSWASASRWADWWACSPSASATSP
jgi:putative transport protein